MSDSAMNALTVEQLTVEMRELRQRIEDLEDVQELEAAIRDNQGKPLIPWETAKQGL